jgi:hypothetical protein
MADIPVTPHGRITSTLLEKHMKTLKATLYSVLLVAIAALWGVCGYNYAKGSIEPQVVKEPVPVEVMVEVAHEYPLSLVLGVYTDGTIKKNPDREDESLMYIVSVHFERGDSFTEATVWLPVYDGKRLAGRMGMPIMVPSDDYHIVVEQISSCQISDLEHDEEPGDEF